MYRTRCLAIRFEPNYRAEKAGGWEAIQIRLRTTASRWRCSRSRSCGMLMLVVDVKGGFFSLFFFFVLYLPASLFHQRTTCFSIVVLEIQ